MTSYEKTKMRVLTHCSGPDGCQFDPVKHDTCAARFQRKLRNELILHALKMMTLVIAVYGGLLWWLL